MTCFETQEQITAWLDGEAEPECRAALEEHLDGCADCRAEASLLSGVSARVRSLPRLQPSASWDLGLERKLSALKVEDLSAQIVRLCAITEALAGRLRSLEAAATPGEIMTLEEVAAYLRVTPEKVAEMLHELPRIEMNYEVRFRRSSIDQWLKLREAAPGGGWFHWDQWVTGSSLGRWTSGGGH